MAVFDLNIPEVWFPVPNHEGYEISSHFRVRSFWSAFASPRQMTGDPHPMKVKLKDNGYLCFRVGGPPRERGLKLIRVSRYVYIHHVVAELTYGPREEGLWVLHKDDVKTNNVPSNLYYGTPSQNQSDSQHNGRAVLGGDRPQAKLTEDDIPEIRRLASAGVSGRKIGRRYGVHQTLISMIVRGERWSHVP